MRPSNLGFRPRPPRPGKSACNPLKSDAVSTARVIEIVEPPAGRLVAAVGELAIPS